MSTLSLSPFQTETVLSQDRATWHAEEWPSRYQRKWRFFFLFIYLKSWQCLIVFFFSRLPQSGRLHEHGNVSVSVWSSEQTEPADAGQRDAGRSVRPALLNCSAWSFLLSTVFCFFFKEISFPSPIFDGYLSFLFFWCFSFSYVWHSDFRHHEAPFIVHCMYSTSVCPQECVESPHPALYPFRC